MHPIRIAAQLHPQHGAWRDLRAARHRSEALGYDIVYTWDHFFPLYGDRDGAALRVLVHARRHAPRRPTRIEIGPLVACNSYRNPDLLADIARTVDHISGGRLDPGHRGRLGRARLRRVRLCVRAPPAIGSDALEARDPAHPRPARASLNPPPRPARCRCSSPGSGERRTLRLVARYADGWHADFPDRPTSSSPRSRPASLVRRGRARPGRDRVGRRRGTRGPRPLPARGRRRLPRDGLHPVHARLQRAGVAGRGRRPLARVARRPERRAGRGRRDRVARRDSLRGIRAPRAAHRCRPCACRPGRRATDLADAAESQGC